MKPLDILKEIYFNDDISMGDILASTKCSEVGDLTLEQAYDLYRAALQLVGEELKFEKGQ